MAKKNSNNEYNSDTISDKSKSLMDFISNIKENSAYNLDVDDYKLEEIEKISKAASENPQQADALCNSNDEKIEVAAPSINAQADASPDNTNTQEAVVTEQMLENAESAFNEDAFHNGFNPSFAFYDDASEHITTEEVIQDNISNDGTDDSCSEKTFERVANPLYALRADNENLQPDKSKKHLIKKFFSVIKITKRLNNQSKTDKSDYQENKSLTTTVMQPIAINKKAFFNGISKKTVSAIIAVVFVLSVLITGGVMASKGLISAFASDDIYGIFVDGKLVAATNQQGKIEEAIDDFLVGYKYLEEQGSLTNLRLSNPYEIRQLTREEIKASVDTRVLTTRSTPQPTTATTALPSADNQQQTTDASATLTTQQTTTTVAQTTAVQTDANGNITQATAIQSNPVNKLDNKITVSQNVEELKTILFYGSEPKKYSVVEGDNISKIAKRENLTLTELMVPNPDLLEDSTIGIEQEILIIKMSGPLKLSFSREVTVTEDIAYKTVEEKSDELYEGETKVTQKGKEGIRQEVTKYDYENSVIAVRTPVSDEIIEEPVNKIVKVGTKKKTSASQSSGITEADNNSSSSDSSFMWPVSGARLSSKFGPRRAPTRGASSYHRGIDLAISSGTPIYASKSGTITISSYVGGYGNLVEVNHGGGMTTRYGHCQTLKVKKGQKVQKGDIIALVGNTGVSTGPHLHFEIRKNGSAVNPLNYLK